MALDLGTVVDEAVNDYQAWWMGVDLELKRVVEQHPGHSDLRGVFTKVTMVNRVYMTGLERHSDAETVDDSAPAARVAKCLVENATELDQRITELQKLKTLGPEDLAQIVDTHAWLVRALKSAGVGRTVSFASKYLHFHAPMVPIFDSIAAESLSQFARAALPRSFRVTEHVVPKRELWCTEYRGLVARFAELYRRVQEPNCRPGTTVKQLDHMLWSRTLWGGLQAGCQSSRGGLE